MPGVPRRNILYRMAESAQATVTTTPPAQLSKAKVIVIKIIALTAISLALIFGQSYASTRFYQPDYVAGFYTGLLEGALMPAALPGCSRAMTCRFMRRTTRAAATRSAIFWGSTPAAHFSSVSPSGNHGESAIYEPGGWQISLNCGSSVRRFGR